MRTGKRFESFLAWVVHARKLQHSAVSPKRKGPVRDEAYKLGFARCLVSAVVSTIEAKRHTPATTMAWR
jgi:hypothetical protein